jgi:hypothetical protein
MDPVVITILVGGSGLMLAFCLGYGVRAYLSARRRARWQYRDEQLPLHQAPSLSPDEARPRREHTKPAG